ncbi:hypothetical protein OSTOST_05062 [Ostertagia ostertagi]
MGSNVLLVHNDKVSPVGMVYDGRGLPLCLTRIFIIMGAVFPAIYPGEVEKICNSLKCDQVSANSAFMMANPDKECDALIFLSFFNVSNARARFSRTYGRETPCERSPMQ